MSIPGIDRRTMLGGALATGLVSACATPREAILPDSATWEKLPTVPYRGKQDDIAFASREIGWYGNGQGVLYRTIDGGDSWAECWRNPGTFVRALGFVDENVGILGNVGKGAFPNVTDTQPLYRTMDGGRSWKPVDRIYGPMPSGICAIDVQTIAAIDRGELDRRTVIHAAGRVGGPAHYLRSADQGLTWTSSDLSDLTAAIYDVRFLDDNVGFLAGTSDPDLAQASGLILRTVDGGRTWRRVFRSGRNYETVWKMHFPDKRTGFATIQNYDPDEGTSRRFVAKTTDGGSSWEEVALIDNHKWRSFGIGFASPTTGWVGGNLGGLETRDGGSTWQPAALGIAVNKFRFVGGAGRRRVYAIGSEVHRLELG